jgi:uncharacterized Zn finger protein
MSQIEPLVPTEPTTTIRSQCPECNARLAVLRVIGGRKASEYWALRCTGCGAIHLDVVKSASAMTH